MRPSDFSSPKPGVRPELCSRIRFSEARCQRCLSVCPVHAIHLTFPALEIDDKCSGCGFCVAACPNEVFKFPAHDLYAMENANGEGTIYCSALLARRPVPADRLPPSIIPCLGSISSSMLLGWVLREGRPVELATGPCEGCPMGPGMELFRKRTGELQSLFDFLGVPFPPATISIGSGKQRRQASLLYEEFQSEERKGKRYSRRDFFRHLRDRALPASGVQEPAPNAVEPGLRRPTENSRRLIELLGKFARDSSAGERVPGFMEMRVDDNCSGCGACVTLCPTGALTMNDAPATIQLQWTPAHCSQCDLCLDVCTRKALKRSPCLDQLRIARETSLIVKVFQRLTCPDCGKGFLSAGPALLCDRCARTGDLMDDVSRMIHGWKRGTVS